MDKIEHVVLVMMENRSFDSMLGWLYEDCRPERNVPSIDLGSERSFEGLQGLDLAAYENVDSTGNIKSGPIRGAWGLNVPNTAPGESYAEVTAQLFGTEKPAPNAVPTMKGYVRDYANLMGHYGYPAADIARDADQVMQTHTPYQLPVLSGLAEHYAVCDMWFSSVPSQTNPNRAFAFCGTSMGMADNGFLEESRYAPAIEELVGYKLGDDRVHARTIFNALHDTGNTTWRIFRESGMLQNNIDKVVRLIQGLVPPARLSETLNYLRELSGPGIISDYTRRLFPRLQDIPNLNSHFSPEDNLDEFHALARTGRLPHFSFIEPSWTIGERGTGNNLKGILFHQGDDYHPPGNLDAGEMLLSQVYQSLIANRVAWEKTLLIITFDEPVGSFDHVPPPAAVPPWGKGRRPDFPLQHDFEFDRYGGRVPAILVSPLIEKSTVFRSGSDVPFDHTSLIGTLLKWRGAAGQVADFGERTRQAPTFEHIVSRTTPRTDERDIRFLDVEHKRGDPVRFYDRFRLRAPNGKYVSRFRERTVAPFSFFSEDPTISEFFPTLNYVDRLSNDLTTTFYCTRNQSPPDRSEIRDDIGAAVEIKLVALEPGLGAYNVLGAWRDAHDCYYFNDYQVGDNHTRQSWNLSKADGSGGVIRFGDRVVLKNKWWNQVLAPDDDLVTTVKGTPVEAVWTIEPVLGHVPSPGSISPFGVYYMKHAKTGAYLTKARKGAVQWFPTLGAGERVRLRFEGDSASAVFVDGMGAQLTSPTEPLENGGSRYDMLIREANPFVYYYYHGYEANKQTWILSLVDGAGYVQLGSKLRLINKNSGQFLVPLADRGTEYLTADYTYSDACDWVLERT